MHEALRRRDRERAEARQ